MPYFSMPSRSTPMPTTAAAVIVPPQSSPTLKVLTALSASHLLNDMMQSLLLALYPLLKGKFALSFSEVGLITMTYQLTASLFQPLIGLYTDRHPLRYSLPAGMSSTLCGLLLLGFAPSFGAVLGAGEAGTIG